MSKIDGPCLTCSPIDTSLFFPSYSPRLATRMIPFVKSILELCLRQSRVSDEQLLEASVNLLVSTIETVPSFITKDQISDTLQMALELQTQQHRRVLDSLLQIIAKKVPTKVLLPILVQIWSDQKHQGNRWIAAYYRLLQRTIRQSDRGALPALVKNTLSLILETFEMSTESDSDHVQALATTSFLDLTEKLSEATFKPLFARLYDWSFVETDGSNVNQRQVMFYKLLAGLISRFKVSIL